MKFYLQYGYGMGDLTKALLDRWSGDTTIVLSPRDQVPTSLITSAKAFNKKHAEVLIDPQMYSVAITKNGKNRDYDYWPTKATFPTGAQLASSIDELVDLNISAGASRIIIPGELATAIDANWKRQQTEVRTAVDAADLADLTPIYTLAIAPEVLSNKAAVNSLLSEIDAWKEVRSIYLILKQPGNEYLLDNANILANSLDIVAGLRLQGIEVIVGYCNHQKLIMAAAGANAICSGTWLNVRGFCLEKFKENDGMAQRSKWYYAPHLLTEFKMDALDVAHTHGHLNALATLAGYGSDFANALFKGPQPSLADSQYDEPKSFKHYLQCMKTQATAAVLPTFKQTFDQLQDNLTFAETQLKALHRFGVSGQQRDFLQYIPATRDALNSLNALRGTMLSRKWGSIT